MNVSLIFHILFMYSLCTLNVNGLRDTEKQRRIIGFFNVFNYDIICLQETHFVNARDGLDFKRKWKGEFIFSPSPTQHSGGVGIAFSPGFQGKLSQVRRDPGGRSISVLIELPDSTVFRLCNIYAPNVPRVRVSFFKNLFHITRGAEPVFLTGDFNCVESNLDRSGESTTSSCGIGAEELRTFTSIRKCVTNIG